MISRQQYLESITQQPELYPVLAEIISKYTGGKYDINTQEGRLCWSYNTHYENEENKDECNQYENKESKDKSCNHYFFNSPLHLNNWLLPIVKEVDKNDTDLDVIYLKNNVKQTINVPPNIFIGKTLIINGKPIENTQESYFEISFSNYTGNKKIDIEFYESMYEILPKDSVDSLKKLITNQLPLSQDTFIKLHGRKSLLIFNASNQQLYGRQFTDNEEKSPNYCVNIYYNLLLSILLSISK